MMNLIKLYRDPAVVVDPPAAVTPAAIVPDKLAAAVVPPVVDVTPKSVSTTVDLNKPATPAAGAFVIPDAFKDKPYLKGIDSMDKLYAMLDGAQDLIGKKGPAIPKADAPQAEKDAYYESIGRPKTPGEYKFDGQDKADPKFLPRLQNAFHKNGLPQEQAANLWKDVQVELQEWMKETGLQEKQFNVDFDKLATESFGAERDKVLARGKELITANISPAMRPAIEKLDNNALVVLADVLRNLDKKYIKPDSAPNAQPTLNGGTPDELRAKAKGLMEQQGKLSPMSQEFTNLQTQIDAIYDQIRKSGVKIS